MTPRRRKTSPVLTEHVTNNVLSQIMTAHGARPLPGLRPSLREVALERIVDVSEFQARRPFNPEQDPEDAELLESVRAVGVRVPVHLQDQGDGTYRIRAGHRRVSAARLAGLPKVRSVVWPPGADAFDAAMDTWLENLHRKDLAPLERGRMLALLLERFRLPRSVETAHKLGLSKTSFYRYLGLLDAPEDVKEALGTGALGVVQAERLATIEDPDVRARLIKSIEQGLSGKRLEEALARHRAGEPLPEHLLNAEPGSEKSGRLAVARQEERAWARRKTRELARALGLGASELNPLAKALQARRISGAHATAAALLVADGDSPSDALAAAAALGRPALRAVETLLKAIHDPGPDIPSPGGHSTLGRMLQRLLDQLEER